MNTNLQVLIMALILPYICRLPAKFSWRIYSNDADNALRRRRHVFQNNIYSIRLNNNPHLQILSHGDMSEVKCIKLKYLNDEVAAKT